MQPTSVISLQIMRKHNSLGNQNTTKKKEKKKGSLCEIHFNNHGSYHFHEI